MNPMAKLSFCSDSVGAVGAVRDGVILNSRKPRRWRRPDG